MSLLQRDSPRVHPDRDLTQSEHELCHDQVQDYPLVVIRGLVLRATQQLGRDELAENVGQSEREPDCLRDSNGRVGCLHIRCRLVQEKGQEGREES